MASDINRIVIVGRLTKDPEVKVTQSGNSVTSFSIANNKSYKNANGEKVETVSFFNCVAWGKLGSEVIAAYGRKGQRVGIEGRLQQRSWEDKEGRKQYAVDIVVENFQFLESGKKDESAGSNTNNGYKSAPNGYKSAPPAGRSENQPEIPNFDDIPDGFPDDDEAF